MKEGLSIQGHSIQYFSKTLQYFTNIVFSVLPKQPQFPRFLFHAFRSSTACPLLKVYENCKIQEDSIYDVTIGSYFWVACLPSPSPPFPPSFFLV